jgi:hypothetical protein
MLPDIGRRIANPPYLLHIGTSYHVIQTAKTAKDAKGEERQTRRSLHLRILCPFA